ncbi:GGDEF domain-containing protein [Solicola sp. PLA-1-18]|uniref:GGDEF domain-containing protein n=1 Tax=Solicola sp. PLA-1-18 TaxID=3380532 RepID=UPI003B81AB1C
MRDTSAFDHGASDDTAFSRACHEVLDYLQGTMPFSTWSVSRLDDHEQTHVYVSGGGFHQPGDSLAADKTLCHRMIDGAPRVVGDATTHAAYDDVASALGIHGYASVPIRLNPREPVGALCGLSDAPIDPDLVDEDLLTLLASMLSHAFALTQRARRLDLQLRVARDDAMTDALTGLLNRRGWEEVSAEAARRTLVLGDRFAVLVVDLDGLKAVNDAEGHAAGDALLVRAGQALSRHIRQSDSVVRMGGDEFVVLVESAFQRSDGEVVARRLRRGLQEAGVEASVGHSDLGRGESPALALARADRSMYADKKARRTPSTA